MNILSRYIAIDHTMNVHIAEQSATTLSSHERLQLQFSCLFNSVLLHDKTVDMPLSPTQVGTWMLEHIKAFRQTFKPLSKTAKVLDRIIEEWKEHLYIARSMHPVGFFTSFFSRLSDRIDWTVSHIATRIDTLPVGHEIALPGSSATESKYPDRRPQLVEYLITRESEETYTFQIVNCRIGAQYVDYRAHLFARLFETAEDAIQTNKMQDRIWKTIPKKVFTQEFVHLLVDPVMNPESTSSIATIQEQIASHFPEKKPILGDIHSGQNREDAAVKTATTWLHQKMKTALWNSFKAFYTQREVSKLDPDAKFRDLATGVLLHRKEKAGKR